MTLLVVRHHLLSLPMEWEMIWPGSECLVPWWSLCKAGWWATSISFSCQIAFVVMITSVLGNAHWYSALIQKALRWGIFPCCTGCNQSLNRVYLPACISCDRDQMKGVETIYSFINPRLPMQEIAKKIHFYALEPGYEHEANTRSYRKPSSEFREWWIFFTFIFLENHSVMLMRILCLNFFVGGSTEVMNGKILNLIQTFSMIQSYSG